MLIKQLAKNKVIIQRLEEETDAARSIRKAGLIMPEEMTKTTKSNRARVLQVGLGSELEELGLKESDEVILSKYSGVEIELDHIKYLIINVGDILGII